MKSLICAFVILAVIITGGILYTNTVINISDEFTRVNRQMINSIEDEDFENAEKEWDMLDKKLSDKKTILTSNIDHTIIDAIEQNLLRIKTCLNSREKNEALTYASILDLQLSHLPRNFKLNTENIL